MRFLIIFFLLLISKLGQSSNPDTLLLSELKKFIYREAGFVLESEFYTRCAAQDKPYIYLYVSRTDKVRKPVEYFGNLNSYGFDKDAAKKDEQVIREKGYHTFCYETNGTILATINSRLLSYPQEALAFVVFHEYAHNYLKQKEIDIRYEFNEAFSDVVGNYGALQFVNESNSSGIKDAKLQIKNNEKIYKYINRTIKKVNRYSEKDDIVNLLRCRQKIKTILTTCNSFQKDRFDYEVNNAFLLKNEYYSKHYFLLKKVFKKQRNLKKFFEIIENLPQSKTDYEEYLKKYM